MSAGGRSKLGSLLQCLPASLWRCLESLREAGGNPLLVGGAVRDALLDLPVSGDWDFVTTLLARRVRELLTAAGAEIVAMDERLGVVEATVEEITFVVMTLREESGYADHRHPDQVRFTTDVALDSVRRDFTVNALYLEPWTGEVQDFHGGMTDLANRTLRVIGDAEERLREDPLRLLRGVRFAASCELTPEASTRRAMTEVAPQVQTLSAERIYQELTRAFCGRGRGDALRLLLEWGLAHWVLPEIEAMPGVEQPPQYHPEGDVFVHVCLVLEHTREGDPVQAWAAVLHDLGKPATFERAADRIRFSGHDVLSAEMADAVLRRLRAPRELRETVVEIARDHIRFAAIPEMTKTKRERWMRSPRFEAHLEFHRADCLGSHGILSIYEAARKMWQDLPPEPPPPLCTGRDVLALGVEKGPVVGEVLRALEIELERDGIDGRDRALARLEKLVRERFRAGS